MALQFRTSMLLNGILYSSEAFISLSDKHINMLEECDLMLMKKIFEAPSSTPKESFYLETSVLPVKFVLIGRRIMFLWSILNKDESELVKQVYNAQRSFPFKESWASLVWNDLEKCNIDITEENLKKMKKQKLKTLIKKKLKEKSDENLMELQAKHSKSINLEISDEPQEYLTSDEINTEEKKLLFNLRSIMLDIKVNFKNKYNGNLRCTFCDKEEESAQHLLNCNEILNNP